jgi:hypothetical protein
MSERWPCGKCPEVEIPWAEFESVSVSAPCINQLPLALLLDVGTDIVVVSIHTSAMSETASSYVHVSSRNSNTLNEMESPTDNMSVMGSLAEPTALSDMRYGNKQSYLFFHVVDVRTPLPISILPGLHRKRSMRVHTACWLKQSLPCTHLGETSHTTSHCCIFEAMHLCHWKNTSSFHPWPPILWHIERVSSESRAYFHSYKRRSWLWAGTSNGLHRSRFRPNIRILCYGITHLELVLDKADVYLLIVVWQSRLIQRAYSLNILLNTYQ